MFVRRLGIKISHLEVARSIYCTNLPIFWDFN
jgi:hypothetical protein